ncbi:MAG: hypothetical protein HY780_14940 [Chloroflexi bacterium]|nr:hypothetical protein [Chloroflexota bacterium]
MNNEFEIFSQRLDAAGTQVGKNDLRISDMGPNGDVDPSANVPAVAYDGADNEFLVVWMGCDTVCGGYEEEELEIYGQRINGANGTQVGANDFRISDMGPDEDLEFAALGPAVAYNSANNEYLVVWWGSDDAGLLVAYEYEIFGQRIDAATGAEVGANDFRISAMGPDGDATYWAAHPAVAYSGTDNQYLVVWHRDGVLEEESEIFGQRLDAATGAEVGANDFRLSDMGPNGNTDYDALFPAVAYNGSNNAYLVVWQGDDDTAPLVEGESEIFGQRYTGVVLLPPVVLKSPLNGARISNTKRPLLDWNDLAGAQTYYVQVRKGSTSGPMVVDAATSVSRYRTPTLIGGGTKYYWRVQACNTGGACSDWTKYWYFIITATSSAGN